SFRRLVSVFGGAWLLAAWLAWWLVPVFDVRKLPRSGVPWHALIGRALARLRQAYDGLLGQLLRKSALALALTAVVIALLTTVLLVKSREPAVPFGATGQDIVLRVSGEDYTRLAALADEITLSLGQVEALHQVRHTGQASRDELSLHLDEESARQLGVDIAAAGKALAIATTGIPAGSFRDAEHHYNVWMRLPPEDSGSAATGKILLLGELEHRPAVHLRDIASLERAEGPARLVRQNGAFVIEISASAKFGPLPAQAQRRVREAIGKIIIPAGYQVSFGRDVDSAEGYRNLVTLVLSVSAIFVVALLFYRSLRPALVVLFPASVTLVVTGAALRLTGLAFSPAVWLGLILLLGLAAGHAAVLLSFAGAQPPNLPLLRRVRQAARQFFRPLLAMAIVGIMGMLPLMWIDGSVSSLSALVSVLALGLVFSLPVNLLLAPLLFRMLWSKEQIPASPRL
ncbi:MAG: efflux RND transporter permease subunit, partial [Gammaproteobacteria bacterium]|nr:efflux RND transporter permease subunit [Gammaproteobacteria bacterium]MDH5512921.1 efflux RND transporter permease subunit [Gammaproteobacteria bacterium]